MRTEARVLEGTEIDIETDRETDKETGRDCKTRLRQVHQTGSDTHSPLSNDLWSFLRRERDAV